MIKALVLPLAISLAGCAHYQMACPVDVGPLHAAYRPARARSAKEHSRSRRGVGKLRADERVPSAGGGRDGTHVDRAVLALLGVPEGGHARSGGPAIRRARPLRSGGRARTPDHRALDGERSFGGL